MLFRSVTVPSTLSPGLNCSTSSSQGSLVNCLQLATEFAGKKLLDLSGLAVGDGSPIPRISYRDAMETYGSDKPDLRFGMELIELTDVFANTEFGVFKNAECIKAICVKNGASLSRKQIDQFTDMIEIGRASCRERV